MRKPVLKAAAINGGGSDRRQAAPPFPRLLLRQALLQGRDNVDHVAAGRLRRRRLAFLTLGIGVNQLFNVFRYKRRDIWRDRILPSCLQSTSWRD
jgi:hypothetical protein